MVQQEQKITALYCRLSQEDMLKGDSLSIVNQRQILTDYAKNNGFTNIKVWCDDGYSGSNFNRPDWKKLEEEIEFGNVDTLIVKDHSRLGRDRLRVGYLVEEKFVDCGVRYIAINDNIDTINGTDEMMAFKDVFNEYHARDTSRKIKAVIHAAANRGERIGTSAPYGYKKDPNNKKKLIPNEETAPIVKYIFELCASGLGPSKIARILKEKQILRPAIYNFQTYGKYHPHLQEDRLYDWEQATVVHILELEEYIGRTVSCKTYRPSFKSKKYKTIPKDKWLRFENTHEAIIDNDTWDIVQNVRSTKRRPNKMGEQDIFSGLIECETCGKKHYLCRAGSMKTEQHTYTCSTYRNKSSVQACTAHTVRVELLHQLVIIKINSLIKEIKSDKSKFLDKTMQNQEAKVRQQLLSQTRDMEKSKKRLDEIDTIFKKTFEQMALGNISDEQFKMLIDGYEKEKEELATKVEVLQTSIETEQTKMLNTDRFIKIIDKYTDIKELSAEIVRELIEKIVIHERSEPHKKKDYTQEIDIYFNFLGKI